jgi:hypothetical protein
MREYTLPKIWKARISKYWDRTIPSNYPKSSSEFSLTYDSDKTKSAVNEMEAQLGTEESVVNEFVDEGLFVSNYFGTYNVSGEDGEYTLLSPEKIETNDDILVLHYDEESEGWEKIEDAELVNGYAWGTVDSFSPIAIFTTKKDIEIVEPDFASGSWLVANGNPIKVFTEDDVVKVANLSNGNVVELGEANIVCGGSVDGSKVNTTNIKVIGVDNNKLSFYAGSYCWDNEDEAKGTTNESINITVVDSKIRSITGAGGRTRVENLNITVQNSSVKSHIGCGETWNTKAKKDANDPKTLGLGSAGWCKNAVINFTDGSYCELVFTGGNTGYSYTDSAKIVAKDSKIDYCVCGGSNGRTRTVTAELDNLEGNIFQTVNRGVVNEAKAVISNSTIPNVFVFGDSTDKTVNGTVESVAINMNAGKYGIKLGVQGGKAPILEDIEVVKYVKVSRSADFEISDNDKDILGNKFIIK